MFSRTNKNWKNEVLSTLHRRSFYFFFIYEPRELFNERLLSADLQRETGIDKKVTTVAGVALQLGACGTLLFITEFILQKKALERDNHK